VRISHRELAECEQSPRRWLAKKNASEGGRRRGYNQLVAEAIYRFHKSGQSGQERRRLSKDIKNAQLTNDTRIEAALRAFDSYVTWCRGAGLTTIECRVNLELLVTPLVTLGGQISRVDLVETGYVGVLLGPHSSGWLGEFRMPLIQVALSSRYARDPSEFSVGVQNLDGTQFEVVSFSAAERSGAVARLAKLAARLERLQKQAAGPSSRSEPKSG
jgi:hypothetical protein